MGMNHHLAVAATLVIMVSGCAAKTWDIRQLETTFVNQTDNREYVQKKRGASQQ